MRSVAGGFREGGLQTASKILDYCKEGLLWLKYLQNCDGGGGVVVVMIDGIDHLFIV